MAGRANLPGSTRERDLLHSFSRMIPELIRHSDRPDTFEIIPDELKHVHRPRVVNRDDAPAGKAEPHTRHGKRRAGERGVGGGAGDDAGGSGGLNGGGSGGGGLTDLWGDEDAMPPLTAMGAEESLVALNAMNGGALGGLCDADAEALLDGAGF